MNYSDIDLDNIFNNPLFIKRNDDGSIEFTLMGAFVIFDLSYNLVKKIMERKMVYLYESECKKEKQ